MLKISLPLVSIIIPVFNTERYVRQCVESFVTHDYRNLEIIVVDDGSTDASPEILKSFGDKITYIRQENKGPSSAINTGIKASKGEFISWFGSDDICLPGRIKIQVKKLLEDQSISVVYSDYILIDPNGDEIEVVNVPHPPVEQFTRSLLMRNFINGSTVLMRRECLEKVGYYDESLRADPDGEMWFRLLKHGYKFAHIPKPLVKYRWHPGSVSNNQELMRACKDKVRLKVLQSFTPKELFGDIITQGGSIASAYQELAWHLFCDFNIQSAELALRKAYEFANELAHQRRI